MSMTEAPWGSPTAAEKGKRSMDAVPALLRRRVLCTLIALLP
jgi:hypothetical protein